MINLIKNPFLQFKSKRNHLLDFLKMVAMLLVVLDHCLQLWVPSIQTTLFYNYIFITQMPVFMFVSGLLMLNKIDKYNNGKDFAFAIIKLVINLLVPFISFSLIKSAIQCSSFVEYFLRIGNAFINPQTSLWFLWVVFWLNLFFISGILISNLIVKKGSFLKSFVAVMTFLTFLIVPLIVFLKWNIFDTKLMIYYSIFYIGGFISHLLFKTKLSVVLEKNLIKIIALLLCVTILALIMFLRPTIILDEETIPNILLRVIGSFASIFSLTIIGYYLIQIKVFKHISKIGMFSLELYYVHLLLLLIPLFGLILNYNLFINITLYFLLYIFIVSLSFLIIFIIKSCAITDLIIFGKERNLKNIINNK